MRPGEGVLAAELDGLGGKVSAGSAGNAKKSGLGSIKEGLCAFCQMQGWKPPVKKRDPALSQAFTGQTSSQSKSRRRVLWGYMQRKGGGRERERGLAKGMGLQSERDVRMSETPFPVFSVSVR